MVVSKARRRRFGLIAVYDAISIGSPIFLSEEKLNTRLNSKELTI
jgi:hypothetical protein